MKSAKEARQIALDKRQGRISVLLDEISKEIDKACEAGLFATAINLRFDENAEDVIAVVDGLKQKGYVADTRRSGGDMRGLEDAYYYLVVSWSP